jgi:DNA-binding transcriptional regulator YhcF (GntR family)
MAHPFHRNKMRWLNAVIYDCGVSPMSCRIAYLIADHLNSVSGIAWPSIDRMAGRLCISTKTAQRAIKELECRGWLSVSRSRGRTRSNRYRPNFLSEDKNQKGDKVTQKTGQLRPRKWDTDVPQSYLSKLPRTFHQSATAGEVRRFPDQGMYEEQIIRRFGPSVRAHLETLAIEHPARLTQLCRSQQFGNLTDRHMEEMILSLEMKTHKALPTWG